MITEIKDFLPHLEIIEDTYNRAVTLPNDFWVRYGTDDVRVIDDDRAIYVVTMGTQATIMEWLYNFWFISREWLDMGRVHSGFADNVEELMGREDRPESLISYLLEQTKINGKEVVFVGHSRGGPISALAASFLIAHGADKSKVWGVLCASPNLGNRKFKKEFNAMLGDRFFTLNATGDLVSKVAPWGNKIGKVFTITLKRPLLHRVHHFIEALDSA